MPDPCWVCEVKAGLSSGGRAKGACRKCYDRLRKRHGFNQWEAVARKAIELGNRADLLAWAICKSCGVYRVSVKASGSYLCQACRDPYKKQPKITKAQRKARTISANAKQKQTKKEPPPARIKGVVAKPAQAMNGQPARVLGRNEARIRTQRINALTRPSTARIYDPAKYALEQARKNPGRIVAVPVGDPILGQSLYFEPYLDRDGTLQVRQLSDNAKGA